MKYVAAVCEVIAILLLCLLSYNIGLYDQKMKYEQNHPEQHDLCHDDNKREAWIAKKDGELRCYFESRSYPHRVSLGGHIGYTQGKGDS